MPPSELSALALSCPVCGGAMTRTFDRNRRSWFACAECECEVSVPPTAWDMARRKREQRWLAKDYRRWWQRRPGQEPG
jgi:hypothetical protein